MDVVGGIGKCRKADEIGDVGDVVEDDGESQCRLNGFMGCSYLSGTSCSLGFALPVHNIIHVTCHSLQPWLIISNEEPQIVVDTSLRISPKPTFLATDGQQLQDSIQNSCSKPTITELLISPMLPEYRYNVTAEYSAQLTPAGPFLIPVLTQAGLFEPRIPSGKLRQMFNLPVWERMPIYLDVTNWELSGSVNQELRSSPEKFKIYTAEPDVSDLPSGNAPNELANAVCLFTSSMQNGGPERCGMNWMC
jgi:hypothetical protein